VKTAFVTGVTGQDGHHLTKLLLSKDYEVHGLVNGQRNSREADFIKLFPQVKLHRGDLTDFSSLMQAIDQSQPAEIYNLGALRLLEAVRKTGTKLNTRIYQASSSEMFGKVRETPQSEQTPFHPRSPYGVAKTFAHYTCLNYREAYEMHISSGILFNHEGEYRGHEFVTRKITSNIAKIKLGKQQRFSLGDLTPQRDWGYAGDYVEAMWMMLQQETPDDYVIATGKTHTIRQFVEASLMAADLSGDLEDYVDFDKEMVRPAEVDLLIGDASKAKDILGWKPSVDFQQLVHLMVDNDLKLEAMK
jgi:GDPmannose 4,6-dehydratase